MPATVNNGGDVLARGGVSAKFRASDPLYLASLRQRLAERRLQSPLFDTPRFTRHLEAAYSAMWQRHRDGLPPDHIVVAS